MKTEQFRIDSLANLQAELAQSNLRDADLVLTFGSRAVLEMEAMLTAIREHYSSAHVLGCTTAGEICDVEVTDDTLVVTALKFEHTALECASVVVEDVSQSFDAGRDLSKQLVRDNLTHVIVFSEGLNVNGSELVRGLSEGLPEGVAVTGGLSGDSGDFEKTLVVAEGRVTDNTVCGVGLYGDRLRVSYGSLGGWDQFGPARRVTRSQANVLYELDGKSALELYKTYLGEQAQGLPATGLLFPLCVKVNDTDEPIVRTILGVDEASQSITFAGDIPEGAYAQLMKANFDRLIDGAVGAANAACAALDNLSAEFALLISCVGRKMVLKQRVEEEVEGVKDILGDQATLAGFYSYGEISPFRPEARCELHNQTMTITAFAEI